MRALYQVRVVTGVLALFVAWSSATAQIPDRILNDARVDNNRATLTIRFNTPVEVSSHTPRSEGKFLRIGLRLIRQQAAAVLPAVRETLPSTPTAAVPVSDIVYLVESGLSPTLELTFTRTVRFTVRLGNDSRSVIVALARDGFSAEQPAAESVTRPSSITNPVTAAAPGAAARENRPYVVNLLSDRQPVDLASIKLPPRYRHLDLYSVEFVKDSRTWYRVRLGFFPTIAAAKEVAAALEDRYPKAWVARASDAERQQFAGAPAAGAGEVAPRGPATEAAAVPEAGRPLSLERQEQLTMQGREAMIRKDYRAAIRIYDKLRRDGDAAARKEAQELLALARERNGQFAQARAEYERYLELYPEGEDADRVRQRLQGMLTAQLRQQAPLLAERQERARAADWRVFGSLSQFYRRVDRQVEDEPFDVVLSTLPTDLSISALLSAPSYDIRTNFFGGYESDFLDTSENEATISTLSVFGAQKDWGLSAEFGRQTRSSGGVLGRFDGAVLSYGVSDTFRVNSVFGFPVLSTSDTSINSDEMFYGLSFDLGTYADKWAFVLYAIEQQEDTLLERRAIGGEARYFAVGRSLFVLLDYDIEYAELNTLLALGTLSFENGASVNISFDQRKSPILTATNGLQGLIVNGVQLTSISEARAVFTDDELRQFALDRTPTITTLTLGSAVPLSQRLQLTGDVNVTHVTDTDATINPKIDGGLVPGTSGTGVDFVYNLQLIGSNLIKSGDITIAGVRYSDLNTSNVYSLNLNTRYPASSKFRINPRFDFIYRSNKRDTGETFTLRPNLRLEYRPWRRARLEAEFQYEWLKDIDPAATTITNSLSLNVGYRVDF